MIIIKSVLHLSLQLCLHSVMNISTISIRHATSEVPTVVLLVARDGAVS
jgi:hypothetical protein